MVKERQSDNRMGWIRNLEELQQVASSNYWYDYEIASECSIPGVLEYQNNIECRQTGVNPNNGLTHYSLKINYPSKEYVYNEETNEEGYYFKEGIIGEILCLFSLFFRCRFYLISTSFSQTNFKNYEKFSYQAINHRQYAYLFSKQGKNFCSGLKEFLDDIRTLDIKNHQQFILASWHYARALKEIGKDDEMAFIRLVSAGEILAKSIVLNSKEDPLKNINIFKIGIQHNLSRNEINDLSNIFNLRYSKKRFLKFVKEHSKRFFQGGNYKAKQLKIKKKDLFRILTAIYDARSRYLHDGEPMYISNIPWMNERYDLDPSVGMTIDNRKIDLSKKLPYIHFFDKLIRYCLLNFLSTNKAIV